ncbi:spore coat protein [Natronospora cellulosivora (SeqCode)]
MNNNYNQYSNYGRNQNEKDNYQNQQSENNQGTTAQYNKRMQYGRNGQEHHKRQRHGQYLQHRNPNQDQYTQSQYSYKHYNNNQHDQEQEYTQGQYEKVQFDNQMQKQQQHMMIKNQNIKFTHQSPEMNERDYLNDILATEKYLSDGLNTFLQEASHTELHTDVKQILSETHDCGRELFNLMFENGFYSFQAASPQEIQKSQDDFSSYLNQQNPYNNESY